MLRTQVNQAFIIACAEDTTSLEHALDAEGIRCELLKQPAIDPTVGYSRSYLCLLNHVRAWQKIVDSGEPGMVVEADFVPVKGFGSLPLPCDLTAKITGMAWLYTCAPQVYYVTEQGHAEGFSTSMVAYLVMPEAARHLLRLAEQIRSEYGETQYSPWDSKVEEFLRMQGFKSYIPFRNYGEHGGIPNPEHLQNRHIWKQLSKCHRADTLYGKLAFLPDYATSGRNLLQVRWAARVKGLVRLLTGRFLRRSIVLRSSVPWRLIGFAVRRQLMF
jgi:hypothetical protein